MRSLREISCEDGRDDEAGGIWCWDAEVVVVVKRMLRLVNAVLRYWKRNGRKKKNKVM